MFCPKCGSEINVKMKFCKKCGEPITLKTSQSEEESKPKKKHLALKIASAAVAVLLAGSIAVGCVVFCTDPCWQLLYSVNKLSHAESFSFELNASNTISVDLPIVSTQTFDVPVAYKGDVEYDIDNAEMIMRAESDDNIIFMHIKDDKYKVLCKDNEAGSKWQENQAALAELFKGQEPVTADNFASNNMIAKSFPSSKFSLSDIFKSHDKLEKNSDLSLESKDGCKEISGTIKLFELVDSGGFDKSMLLSLFVVLLGGKSDLIEVNSKDIIDFSDVEFSWKSDSDNYPCKIGMNLNFSLDALDVISDKLENNSDLKNIMGIIDGYTDLKAKCDTDIKLSIDNYNKADVNTEDVDMNIESTSD